MYSSKITRIFLRISLILLKATEAAILTQSKEELEAVVVNSVEATATTITDSIMEVILNKDSTETSITTTTKEVREQEATTTITTIKEVAIATMVTLKAVVTVTTVISLEENLNRPNKVKAVNSMDKMVPRD